MKVRVWKLGNLEHHVYPSQEQIDALTGLLKSWDGEEDLDLVWGTDIRVELLDCDTGDLDVIVGKPEPDGTYRVRIVGDRVEPVVVEGGRGG